MLRRTFLLTSTLLAPAVALPMRAARAHHGWGSYDAAHPLTLSGEVASIAFQNPHGILMLKVPDKTWEVVLAPPSRMIARGLRNEQITAGQRVEVMGYPSQVHGDELRAEWIKVADTTYQLR
jgi:DNA/RNA endonuclease YhcR with UshA esterase domain